MSATLSVANPPHRDRKANHEASALGQGDPPAGHTPDFGGDQVRDYTEIVLNASPLNHGAVEVVLGEENGGDERHDDRRQSERDYGLEEGEAGSAAPYQGRATKVAPLKDGPEPLDGVPETPTCRKTAVESLTVTNHV